MEQFGEVFIPKADLIPKYNVQFEDKVKDICKFIMDDALKCSCPLIFYGGVRKNKNNIYVTYGKCAIKKHSQYFKFLFMPKDDNTVQLIVSINKKYKAFHDIKDDEIVYRSIRDELLMSLNTEKVETEMLEN